MSKRTSAKPPTVAELTRLTFAPRKSMGASGCSLCMAGYWEHTDQPVRGVVVNVNRFDHVFCHMCVGLLYHALTTGQEIARDSPAMRTWLQSQAREEP